MALRLTEAQVGLLKVDTINSRTASTALYMTGGSTVYISSASNTSLIMRMGTTEVARVSAKGNFIIGAEDVTTTDYKLKVTGATGFASGHLYLTGANATSSTGNTTQLVFGEPGNNHVAVSSNTKALVINPNTTDTTNQIVLYLDKHSLFPGGINVTNATDSTSTTTGSIITSGGIGVAKNIYSGQKINAAQGFGVNATTGTGIGISLYNGSTGTTAPTYGLMFAKTATFSTHGKVSGDWATYFTMNESTNRGWIFRCGNTNIASISGAGDLSFNGALTHTGQYFYQSGDATMKFYPQTNTTYGSESIAIQTCFDGQDGSSSTYVSSYENRCNLLLQPRGGQVYIGVNHTAVGDTTNSLTVGGNAKITNLLTTGSGANHYGIKVGDTYINAIGGNLILQNNSAIRFGADSWDYNVWAGLKYNSTNKYIYLGLADGTIFTANSAQSGGRILTPGISYLHVGNQTTYYIANDGSIKASSVTVDNSNSSGSIQLVEDGEGGTIRLYSKSNTYCYEIDAYNDETIRIHTASKNPSGTAKFISWNGKNGNLSLDGLVYIKNAYPAMAMTSDGSYWGMGTPDAGFSAWIRTTSNGIIPYSSNATNGVSSLGTSSWPFAAVHAKTFYGALNGNATTATTLATARTLTIGKTGKTFNGGANVAWSLSEIGAWALDGSTSCISLTGGDGNTTGYRLIGQASIAAWNNRRLSFIVSSRHTGNGLVTISYGCNSATVSAANCYCNIRYFGISKGDKNGAIESDSFCAYVSSDGATMYFFWKYRDYNTTHISVLNNNSAFVPSNGTWITSIGSTYGTAIATTCINMADSVFDSGNNSTITFNYSAAGLSSTSWLAAWNGYELRAITPANITAGRATADASGNTITSTYLKLSGGTMTGSLTISHATSATVDATTTNPRITFSENGTQPVMLVYSDYDSYRAPAGLKVIGGTSATPAWFEVEGNSYTNGTAYIGGGYVEITKDGEGGTIKIHSKSNTYIYEIDAYNDETIRIHTATKNPNGAAKFISWNGKNGNVDIDGKITSKAVKGGMWIAGTHDATFVANTATTAAAGNYYQGWYSGKTQSGAWSLGALAGSESLYFVYGTDGNYNAGTNTTTSVQFGSGGQVYGAVWNDYAEYRRTSDNIEAGRVVVENNDDTLSLASKRLMPGANIVSDTFGFAIGETEKSKTPIAVSGRVLAYPFEPREEYCAGDPVCSGPNGTVSKMTREEVMMYPDRMIGTVSAIPSYETWGTGNVPVNGRIWIKVI